MKSRVEEGCQVLEWMNGCDGHGPHGINLRCHDSRHVHTKMLWFVKREWAWWGRDGGRGGCEGKMDMDW